MSEEKQKTIWDILNNLIRDKKYDPSEIPELNTYLITRAIGKYPDCVFYANAINELQNRDNERIYDFFFYSIPAKRRYAKWFKSDKDNEQCIQLLIKLFTVSRKVAEGYLSLLSEEDKKALRLFEGGLKK